MYALRRGHVNLGRRPTHLTQPRTMRRENKDALTTGQWPECSAQNDRKIFAPVAVWSSIPVVACVCNLAVSPAQNPRCSSAEMGSVLRVVVLTPQYERR